MKKNFLFWGVLLVLSFSVNAQPATGLHFDGTNDYVSCGNILTPSYTKEAWINLDGLAFFNNIISSGGTAQHAFWAPASYGSRLSAGHNLVWNEVQDPTPLVAGVWYHVAVTYDAATNTMNLYKNGILVNSNSAVSAFTGGTDVSLGTYGTSTAVLFGRMDEARIWNRALGQAEIQNNMNCELNPTGQIGLNALYHFDQGIINADNTAITSLTDASGNGNNGTLNNFTLNGTTSNWAAGNPIISSICPLPTLAGTAGGPTVSKTVTISPSGTHYLADNGNFICYILPSGGSPVAGSITSRVTIDASVQTYGSSPYVQRHYDIEPATNPATATATVTLYFTQAEFDNYNTFTATLPDLPTGPGDATGIGNLRITQYHGTGTAPGNYSGSATLVDPNDANIVWNATLNRWEVTFDVNGFSGFYVHTSVGGVLPVNLTSFNGISDGDYNKLQWSTESEQNSSHFDIERSIDGLTFTKVITVLSSGNTSERNSYSYSDLKGNDQVYFYRLKITDKDGAFKYSPTIRISSKQKNTISVYPNPARETINISVSETKMLKTDVRISDVNGRLVSLVKLVTLQQTIDISNLNSGTYVIKFEDGRFAKFVKQ